jgi:anti-sigma regulatory factor (Ser/Thr protein kinase)
MTETHPPNACHDAFMFDSDNAYVDHVAPHLLRGLAADEAVIAVTAVDRGLDLRDELGSSDAARVSFFNCDDQYLRPAHTIAAYDTTIRRHVSEGAAAVRVVGELPHCQTAAEWDEWMTYEAILNRAFAAHPVTIMCTYDARVVPGRVLEEVWRTHPAVTTDARHTSPHYHGPEQVLAALTPDRGELPELPVLPAVANPEELRELLADALRHAGIPSAGALKLLLAADEVARNAWAYADGPTRVRAGLAAGRFLCEIADDGPGIGDLLAGYVPPAADGGRGLWIARQLMYRVDVLDGSPGAVVRLWL